LVRYIWWTGELWRERLLGIFRRTIHLVTHGKTRSLWLASHTIPKHHRFSYSACCAENVHCDAPCNIRITWCDWTIGFWNLAGILGTLFFASLPPRKHNVHSVCALSIINMDKASGATSRMTDNVLKGYKVLWVPLYLPYCVYVFISCVVWMQMRKNIGCDQMQWLLHDDFDSIWNFDFFMNLASTSLHDVNKLCVRFVRTSYLFV
jgi:hypothetical protein